MEIVFSKFEEIKKIKLCKAMFGNDLKFLKMTLKYRAVRLYMQLLPRFYKKLSCCVGKKNGFNLTIDNYFTKYRSNVVKKFLI